MQRLSNSFSEDSFRQQAQEDGISHISTGVAVVRNGKILLVRRVANDFLGGVYELPGGGVDDGETIADGAMREVKEETGLTPTRIIAQYDGFDYSTDRKPKVRQVNFVVEVEPGDVVLDPTEHDAYKWIDEGNLTDVEVSGNMLICVQAALKIINVPNI